MYLLAKGKYNRFRFVKCYSCTRLAYLKIITGFSASLANLATDAIVYKNVQRIIIIGIICH